MTRKGANKAGLERPERLECRLQNENKVVGLDVYMMEDIGRMTLMYLI